MLEIELKTLHLTAPFQIAHGATAERQVLRLHHGQAVGEAPFVPYYGDDPEKSMAWLRGEIQGKAPKNVRLAQDLLRLDHTPHPIWTVAQETLGKGRPWGEIQACRSFSIPTDLAAFAKLVQETSKQFRVLKLKLGSGDLALDEATVRTAFENASGATLIADVNGGWSVEQTLEMLPKLSEYLAMVEQPIHHRLGLKAWQELEGAWKSSGVSLFADESTQNAEDVQRFAPYIDGVNVKLLKCASFTGAIEMIQTARQHRLSVMMGCMIESSIGTTAAAHLAPWADYVDLDGHLYLADDDYVGITFDASGHLQMPEGSGIGAKPRLRV